MAKKTTFLMLQWSPWCIAAVALVLTVRALLGQVALQSQLNQALSGVYVNVAIAGRLTAETANALEPLSHTAVTLQSMNGTLKNTVGDLASLNGSMGRVVAGQQTISGRLDSLNSNMRDVVTRLNDVGAKNNALLSVTTALAAQTGGEAKMLTQLSDSAAASIRHMETLNHRLGFLAQLPF